MVIKCNNISSSHSRQMPYKINKLEVEVVIQIEGTDVVVEEVNKEEAEENSQVAQEEVDSIKETTAKSRVSTLLNQVDASEQTVDNTIRQALTIPSHRNIRSHASGETSASI